MHTKNIILLLINKRSPRKTSLHCCHTCWKYASSSGCISWTPDSVQRQQSEPSKSKQMQFDATSYFSSTFISLLSFKTFNKFFQNSIQIYKNIKINTIIYSIGALFLKLTTDRDHTTDSTATEFILTMILKETKTRRLADWQSHKRVTNLLTVIDNC